MSENNSRELHVKVETGNMEAIIHKMTEYQVQAENLQKEKEELLKQIDAQKRREFENAEAKGSLPASLNGSESTNNNPEVKSPEFETVEDMLSWCKNNNPVAYAEIKKKTFNGLLQNKSYFEWTDKFDANGDSIIMRTVKRDNERIRKERLKNVH